MKPLPSEREVSRRVEEWLRQARQQLEEGRLDLALSLLEKAHNLEPDHIEVGFELAEARVAAGYIAQASELFRQVAHRCLDRGKSEQAMKAFFLLDLLKPR